MKRARQVGKLSWRRNAEILTQSGHPGDAELDRTSPGGSGLRL